MNENSIIPSPGWVFVRRVLPAKQTASGIHIPDTARSRNPGITPGEASCVTVLAVSPLDRDEADDNDGFAFIDGSSFELPEVGDKVFVLATNENLVPVVTDDYGMCTLSNGFQTPETYLFKLEAIAGRIAPPAPANDQMLENTRTLIQSAKDVAAERGVNDEKMLHATMQYEQFTRTDDSDVPF